MRYSIASAFHLALTPPREGRSTRTWLLTTLRRIGLGLCLVALALSFLAFVGALTNWSWQPALPILAGSLSLLMVGRYSHRALPIGRPLPEETPVDSARAAAPPSFQHDQLSSLFKPFFIPAKPAPPEGTGVGLAMVNNLITNLAASQPPQPGAAALLIERDEAVRKVLASALAQLGYHVRQAQSGDDAAQLLRAGPAPDLVLLDIEMPGLSALNAAKSLRQLLPSSAVVFLTGSAEAPLLASPSDPAARFAVQAIHPQLRSILPQVLAEARRPVGQGE